MAVLASRCRVWLNGVDISAVVQGVEVSANVGELVTSRLTLTAPPAIQQGADGVWHFRYELGERPAQGPLRDANGPVRGIKLRPDHAEVW